MRTFSFVFFGVRVLLLAGVERYSEYKRRADGRSFLRAGGAGVMVLGQAGFDTRCGTLSDLLLLFGFNSVEAACHH